MNVWTFSVVLALSIAAAAPACAASLEKAKALRTNGLLSEAKKELVELSFTSDAIETDRAEALLLLGDIAVEEDKLDVAQDNWSKVSTQFSGLPAATIAKEKLALLEQLTSKHSSPHQSEATRPSYAPGSVLVIGPAEYPWSTAQISGALGDGAVPFTGTLTDAMREATAHPSIVAFAEIALSVDSAFESGRVVCLLPNGKKVWEEKVMFNLGGGEERVARRFVDGLSGKVRKRKCP